MAPFRVTQDCWRATAVLRHFARRCQGLSVRQVVGKAIARAEACRRKMLQRRRDASHGSYTVNPPIGKFLSYLSAVPEKAAGLNVNHGLIAWYCDHRFDLLGSGWRQVRHGMLCQGTLGHRYDGGPVIEPDAKGDWLAGHVNTPNVTQAQRIWRLVDPDYVPIDWQLDFKSGYRWSELTWSRDIRYGELPDVDVKVPWELARMQHLPQLAIAYAASEDEPQNRALRQRLAREFRNQVLDFAASNPPRFGVNWSCTMDVAIRVVNWLVAYDLFRALGVTWDEPFEHYFKCSVYDHGRHIADHLEWSPVLRGNHYLADIAGLLFVAAYLPRNAETDAWLAFAVTQLIQEVSLQFHADGSNFEASTSYHRLSAEMVAFATALTLGLGSEKRAALSEYDVHAAPWPCPLPPPPVPMHRLPNGEGSSPFPGWYFERLERMGEFAIHVTKPAGNVHQVGDNDSGRFLKLQPSWQRMTVEEATNRFANLAGYDELPDDSPYWMEDPSDPRPLVAALSGLLERPDFDSFCGPDRIERALISKLQSSQTRMEAWLGSSPEGRGTSPQDSKPGASLRSGPAASARADKPPMAPQDMAPRTIEGSRAHSVRIGDRAEWTRLLSQFEVNPELRGHECLVSLSDPDVFDGVECLAYPDFGLFIWRSDRIYLAARCGPVGQNGFGGHAHNDQLAVELQQDGRDLSADPGTYLYTPDAASRNAYRSVAAHFAPQTRDHREPASLRLGLFELGNEAQAQCLYFGPEGFIGRHQGYGRPVYRTVQFAEATIRIIDYADPRLPLKPLPQFVSPESPVRSVPLSIGYGVVLASPDRSKVA